MKSSELKSKLAEGALSAFSDIYADTAKESRRFISAIEKFENLYGEDRDVVILSAPGRSEILGNHTDHNRGCVMAAAIDRDIIAVAAKRDDGVINLTSEGYPEDSVRLSEIDDPNNFENYSSRSLIAGVAKAFTDNGYTVGGYDAYTTTEVLKGSGLSSSAAFEVIVGAAFNYLYNGGAVANTDIAIFAQYAENVYFGKPCGLMDQMASAVGGFVFIDFEDPASPVVMPIDFSLSAAGYSLCIVNTGGNHADLTPDYAAVPQEMRSVAAAFGKEVLRGITEEELIDRIPVLRASVGDRAILRAIHFINENKRVLAAKLALEEGRLDDFFSAASASGNSSFKYLQNVYTNINIAEQGLSLALALADSFGSGVAAHRVHGGGFAGTIQAFVEDGYASSYCEYMDKAFGAGAAMRLRIRPTGACKLFG